MRSVFTHIHTRTQISCGFTLSSLPSLCSPWKTFQVEFLASNERSLPFSFFAESSQAWLPFKCALLQRRADSGVPSGKGVVAMCHPLHRLPPNTAIYYAHCSITLDFKKIITPWPGLGAGEQEGRCSGPQILRSGTFGGGDFCNVILKYNSVKI